MIHPELRKAGMVFRSVLPYFKPSTFRKANFMLRPMVGKSGKDIHFEQVLVPRKDNDSKLRLCIYKPKNLKENVPGVLWMHGGGYGMGIPEQSSSIFSDFICESSCIVVAPEYTLSVTAPYPAALDDCYAALLWLRDNAQRLGVRTDQLMVGGESAGGGLAIALTIYARDKGEVAIAFQMPLYPMIDDRMITTSSQNNDAPVWNTKSNETGWKLYLGALYGTDKVPVYAAPARLKDFRNLPPAFTFVGSIDPFCDETIEYMENLKKAGVNAQYKVFDGCYHGFDILVSKSTPAKEAKRLLMENFKFAAENYF